MGGFTLVNMDFSAGAKFIHQYGFVQNVYLPGLVHPGKNGLRSGAGQS